MGTKGVPVLQAGKISNLKNHNGGLVHSWEGWRAVWGQLAAVCSHRPLSGGGGGYCFGDAKVTCSLPPPNLETAFRKETAFKAPTGQAARWIPTVHLWACFLLWTWAILSSKSVSAMLTRWHLPMGFNWICLSESHEEIFFCGGAGRGTFICFYFSTALLKDSDLTSTTTMADTLHCAKLLSLLCPIFSPPVGHHPEMVYSHTSRSSNSPLPFPLGKGALPSDVL